MIDKQKAKLNTKVQWTRFIVVLALYLLFLYWIKNWWGLLVVPFIYDVYITKKICWQWWKDAEAPVRFVMSWVDALVSELVAVYFINLFVFQNYVIPSPSLEKLLLTGNYLFVSKVNYGPCIPQTSSTMPLTQHTLPTINTRNYIEFPHWDYRRMKGLGNVKLNGIVVFNYPAGDTVCTELPYQTEYYSMVYGFGQQIFEQNNGAPVDLNTLNKQQQHDYLEQVYVFGRQYVTSNPVEFGSIDSRPTDRCESYVRRYVGPPGQTLQIENRIVYLDNKPNEESDNVQCTYYIKLKQHIPGDLVKELGISMEDLGNLNQHGCMPLTKATAKAPAAHKDIVESIRINANATVDDLYPLNAVVNWTRGSYGPIWISTKGKGINPDMNNIAAHERPIHVYENNELKIKNNQVYINGRLAKSYALKMDYYWMMGDSRHNSTDSRYWGFVPGDHIVGKPIFIWWSSDPDRKGLGGIRWNRLFNTVDSIK